MKYHIAAAAAVFMATGVVSGEDAAKVVVNDESD